MIRKKRIAQACLLILFVFTTLAYSQTETRPLHERPIISVLGRLSIEKHGQEDWLVLHAKNAETYHLTGNLQDKLKNSLLDLGEENLFFVTGKQDGSSSVSCTRSYKYETKKKGQRELKTDSQCIRYYNLEVTDMLFAKKSDEKIPLPKRDIEEEKRLSQIPGPQPLIPPIIGEIYGKISALNLKSPIKTVEVTNRDKDSPMKKLTLVISPDTRIAKNIGKQEPMALPKEALKDGQEVTAVYSRSEFKAEALFITITKE